MPSFGLSQVFGSSEGKPGPLDDLRVLELADEKCQLTGKLLAELGADTITIEPPSGSGVRGIGPFLADIPNPNRSLYFWAYNTSKRSITLNLEQAEGRDILRRLARTADVLVEANPPGYLDSLGIGYDHLSQINPRLILTSVTPFGQTGPYKDWKASDLTMMAIGGIMYVCGYDDWPGTPESEWRGYDGKDEPGERTPPIRGGGYQGWNTGNHFAMIGTMAALFSRDFSGEGQHVDASIAEAVNSTTENSMPQYILTGDMVHRMTMRHAAYLRSAPQHARCTDGTYIFTFGGPRWLGQFLALINWMRASRPGSEEDLDSSPELRAAFATGHLRTLNQASHIVEVTERFINTMSTQEAYHGGHKIELPWGIVRSPEELLTDPHLWDREMFETVYQEEAGRAMIVPGHPYCFTETPWRIYRPAPLLGEHNEEILCGELGYTKPQLGAMREAGII